LICLGAKSKLFSSLFESDFHLGVTDCFVHTSYTHCFTFFFIRVGELRLLLGSMLGCRHFFGCDLSHKIGFIEALFEAPSNRLYSFNHEMWSRTDAFFSLIHGEIIFAKQSLKYILSFSMLCDSLENKTFSPYLKHSVL